MKKLNLIGQKFGLLTVIAFAYSNHHTFWKCKCDCGNDYVTKGTRLKNNRVKSCGCVNRRAYKHGMSYPCSPFYSVWATMLQRCSNKNHMYYKNYGGRGITVCKQWLKFENFRDDMYEDYKEHKLNNRFTTIERIDNDCGYNLNNCKWATRKEQSNNMRNNILNY